MFSFIGGLIAGFKAILTYFTLGALSTLSGVVVYRIIGGLTGLAAAAVIGGAVTIAVSGSSYFGAIQNQRMQDKINQLQYEKNKLQQQLDVEKAAAEVHEKVIKEYQEKLVANQIVLDKLDEAIKAHEGDEECVIHQDEIDIIKELQS